MDFAIYRFVDATLPPVLVLAAIWGLFVRLRAEKSGCAQCPLAAREPSPARRARKYPLVVLNRH